MWLTADVDGGGASWRSYARVSGLWVLPVWQSMALGPCCHDWRSSLAASRRRHRHWRPHISFTRPTAGALHWRSLRYVLQGSWAAEVMRRTLVLANFPCPAFDLQLTDNQLCGYTICYSLARLRLSTKGSQFNCDSIELMLEDTCVLVVATIC